MSEIMGVLFAVFIATMAIPKIASWQQTSNSNNLIAVTAQQQKQLNVAVSSYTQQNAVAIQAVATATSPATITVAMLQATNMLPSSFSANNPFGQTWQAEVLQPTAGNLNVLTLSIGGTALSDMQVSKIAALVPNGGFIPTAGDGYVAGIAYGASASWQISTANFTDIAPGHPASLLTFNQGQLVSNSLYRNAVPGQPQLNTMNTPLIMGATNVAGQACTIGSISRDANGLLNCPSGVWTAVGAAVTTTPVVTVDTACSPQGAIAKDATGLSLSCVSGIWRKQDTCQAWGGDLNTLETAGCYNGPGLGNAPTGDWFFVEVMRHYNTANWYVIQRATGMTGGAANITWTRSQQSGAINTGWSAWQNITTPSYASAAGSSNGVNLNTGGSSSLCLGGTLCGGRTVINGLCLMSTMLAPNLTLETLYWDGSYYFLNHAKYGQMRCNKGVIFFY